jgi:septal ring factor EnvC (AmiA/AmiB activator)
LGSLVPAVVGEEGAAVPGRHADRRRVRRIVALAIALVLAAVPAAGAVPSEAELAEAEARAAELEELIEGAEAELATVQARLDELEVELSQAQEQLDAATEVYLTADRAATEAADRAAAAETARRAAVAEQADNQRTVTGLARDTYKYGAPAASPVLAVLGATGTADDGRMADRLHYLQRGIGVRAVALERSAALTIEVAALTERANEESAEAERALLAAEGARDDAAIAHTRVADLTSETSEKLERSAQLVAALEGEQAEVAEQVQTLRQRVAEERAEAERRAREQAERERAERERAERERAERERAERERAQQRSTSSSGSGSSGGGNAGSSGGGSTAVRPGPNPQLVTVGGITVAASLGPQLAALLDHARRDGIVLGGHGWRSPEITARLRMTNGCPDVYESPASSCRVPTARPGESEHEKGLAVDFTYQGQTICFPRPGSRCTGNAAFDWLRANAGRYGLYNLPSEAWHWSTTGR